MMNFKANLKIFALFFAIVAECAEFDYCNQGYWIEHYETCGGLQQSPIELNYQDVPGSSLNSIPPLRFVNYHIPYQLPAKVENNGHTLSIQLPNSTSYVPHITGGALPNGARYVVESMHYHWGSSDSHGSEHVINGKRYPMEMHIVHRNSKYLSVTEAIKHSDGLAVVGVMYNVVSETSHSRGLEGVVNILDRVRNFAASTEIINLYLSDFIGELNDHDFFTYPGSLTTPTCAEVVTWHVMDSPVQMSQSQIGAFRALIGEHGEKLENNFRGLQVKGNRPIRWYSSLKSNIIDAEFQQESPAA